MKRTKITNQTTIFVKEILVMLMKKCSKVKSFIGAIIREQQFSCCLFRILGSTMTKDGLAMLELIAKMVLDGLTAMKVTKHPLINILHQIRKSNSVSRVGKKNVSLEDSIQGNSLFESVKAVCGCRHLKLIWILSGEKIWKPKLDWSIFLVWLKVCPS